jgi:hypothetical protein
MQITLDLPDDVCADAEELAKLHSRSVVSLVTTIIRSLKSKRLTLPLETQPTAESTEAVQRIMQSLASDPDFGKGHSFPLSPGRQFSLEEFEKALDEDGLP